MTSVLISLVHSIKKKAVIYRITRIFPVSGSVVPISYIIKISCNKHSASVFPERGFHKSPKHLKGSENTIYEL